MTNTKVLTTLSNMFTSLVIVIIDDYQSYKVNFKWTCVFYSQKIIHNNCDKKHIFFNDIFKTD